MENEMPDVISEAVIAHDELAEAAKPLAELLKKKSDPMTTAIVTGWRVKIVRNVMGCPVNDDDEEEKS